MKIGHIILIVVGIIFGLMIGSFLLGIALGLLTQGDVVKEIGRLYEHRFLLFVLSLVLFYCCYIVTRTLIKRTSREEIFLTMTEFGRVSVSLAAVKDIVRKTLRRVEQVKKYKLDMYAQAKKLVVKIVVKQYEGEEIAAITGQLTDDLKAKLHKVLGLAGNVEVHVKIDGFDSMPAGVK